ncbi:hypothetical protein PVK06_045174 [Gossypium arboreum]|uniref:Uncharacterized protein n=1 Tax=Gossypium arboreum TaxID=29729 RepID=A0ABR0MTA4_GOSAR|nr:hypothetical protein PVK06_045174 [Gossypium arboreum]
MNFRGKNFADEKEFEHNWGSELTQSYPNPNLIPIGYGSRQVIKGIDKCSNLDIRVLVGTNCGKGPMELQEDDENDPLISLEGKKHQYMVNDLVHPSSNASVSSSHDISATLQDKAVGYNEDP